MSKNTNQEAAKAEMDRRAHNRAVKAGRIDGKRQEPPTDPEGKLVTPWVMKASKDELLVIAATGELPQHLEVLA